MKMEFVIFILRLFMLLPLFLSGVILACTTSMSGGLYTADCTGRGMIEIPLGLPSDIKALDFKNNSLIELFDNMFSGFKELHHLYLSFNDIRHIEHEAFFGIKNLLSLDLEGNQLSTVPYDVFHDFPSLVHLNLNRNPLKLIKDYAFPGLPALEFLSLEHCEIKRIEKRAFLGLNQLKELSLTHNELTTLNSGVHQSLRSHNLVKIKLWRNPWHCDCNIRWLKVWLKMAQDDIVWWEGDKVPTCSSPHRMERKEWPNLQIDQFACIPTIGTTEPQVKTFVGTNISLTCEIFARPKGTAKWYKGTKMLEQQNLYRIVNMYGNDYNFTTTLKLYNVKINDTGQYYCMGRNYAGQAESNIELLVTKRTIKPHPDFIYFDLGTIVGIILAAVIIIALIVITCYLIVLRREKKRKKQKKKNEKLNATSITSDIVYTSNTKSDLLDEDDGPKCTVKIKNAGYYTDPYHFPDDEDEEEKTHIFSNQQHHHQWQGSLGMHNPTASPSGSDTIRSNRSGADTVRSTRSNRRTNQSTISEDTASYHDNKSTVSSTVPCSTFRPERPYSSAYVEGNYVTRSPVPAVSQADTYHSSTYNPAIDTGKLNLDDDPYYYGTIV